MKFLKKWQEKRFLRKKRQDEMLPLKKDMMSFYVKKSQDKLMKKSGLNKKAGHTWHKLSK